MKNLRFASGIGSTAGGALWVTTWLIHNSAPEGCIGAECANRAMRGFTPAVAVLLALSVTALAIGWALLLLQVRAHRGRLGATGMAGGGIASLGLSLLAAAGIGTYVDSNWEWMPVLVVPGVALLTAGSVLVIMVVAREVILPPWSALTVAIATLLLPMANEQTSRVLLAVPFGLVWVLAGGLMLATAIGSMHAPEHEARPARHPATAAGGPDGSMGRCGPGDTG